MTGREKTPPVLELRNVSRSFGTKTVLDGISFRMERGEIIGLVGRSGAGKSTLLKCLCGLEKPDSGYIFLNGRDLAHMKESELMGVRQQIGLVFQHFNLLSSRTVRQNIALPLEIASWSKEKRCARVEEMLKLVGMENFGDSYPSRLSGGQKQRVGIARALAGEPGILLCDEATSALDPESTSAIIKLLEKINRGLHLTIVLITHEMDVIKRLAPRVLALDKGRLVQDGPFLDLLWGDGNNPALGPLIRELRPRMPPFLPRELARQAGRPGVAEDPENSGPLRLIRVALGQKETLKPFFSELGQRFGIRVNLFQGGVENFGDQLVGDMILGVPAAKSDGVLKYLQAEARKVEDLGVVPCNS